MPNDESKFAIRAGHDADLAALCLLEATAFSGDRLSPERLRHWLRAGNGTLLVAAAGGEVIGYGLAIYRRDSRAGRIYSLAIDPAARGRGVASSIIARLERNARRRGCREMRLEVASRNTGALALYERLGYRRFGQKPGYYADGDCALLLRKPLVTRT